MSVLEGIERGRVWILTSLFQVVEEYDCILDDLLFIPTNDGQQLTLKMNGKIISAKFVWSEIAGCAEGGGSKMQVLSNREVMTQRLRDLLSSHQRGYSHGRDGGGNQNNETLSGQDHGC